MIVVVDGLEIYRPLKSWRKRKRNESDGVDGARESGNEIGSDLEIVDAADRADDQICGAVGKVQETKLTSLLSSLRSFQPLPPSLL